MPYFAFLTSATAVIATLAVVLYLRTRDVGVLLGQGALYYWSLFGAWYILIDKSGGFSGKHYQYLEHKLFPVSLDADYMMTLALYSGFILAVQLTLLFSLRRPKRRPVPRLLLRHEPILILAFTAGAASLYLIGGKISAAWALNTSAYLYTRSQTDEWFTIHQVLNRMALIPPAIGFATLVAGERSRYFISVTRRYTFAAYIALFAGMGVLTFVLGNKNEVLVALLTGFLAYMGSVRRPRLWKVALTMVLGMWFLSAIDFFRGVPIPEMRAAVVERLSQATDVEGFMTSSNEAFAAHFSMYGVLAAHAEPKFGYSFYALACSVVPRILWPNRPRDIYLYYSESVGAIQNQGYSIHHATGWYLSFGYTGVLLGGVVMGLAWAWCLKAHQRIRPGSGLLFRLTAVFAPWMFAAGIPPLVRAGPEGYKGMIVEGLLIPLFVLALACRAKRRGKIALFLAPHRDVWASTTAMEGA